MDSYTIIKIRLNQDLPKLSDKLCENVLEFGSEMSPHIVFDAPDTFHLNTELKLFKAVSQSELRDHFLLLTITVACDARVFGSIMKRRTLMKPKAALTISLVRDESRRQMLCSSCSMVLTSMASVTERGVRLSPVCKHEL